jgi:hypothetical protein
MAIWFAASILGHRREAWDSDLYWAAGYPAAMLACAALGFFFPRSTWRWALTLFLSQYAAMAILAGEIGNLWPIGLALLAVLSLPGMLFARGGAWLRSH